MNTITKIISTVCYFYGIDQKVLNGKTRKREIVWCRQLSMYFAKKYTKLSLSDIGREIGKKDHATVLHACKTVNNIIDTERDVKIEFMQLDKQLSEFLNIIPSREVRVQVRLNPEQYFNGKYLYSLFGAVRFSKTRTFILPLSSPEQAYDMFDERQIDSINIHINYRQPEPESEYKVQFENQITEVRL